LTAELHDDVIYTITARKGGGRTGASEHMVDETRLKKLRTLISESLRVQQGGAEHIEYIDPSNTLTDIAARQNHVVFGRRGCGKTLLLHHSAKSLPQDTKRVYLNCEDFKNHSFPNVLIEILTAIFRELEKNLGGWFGRKRKVKDLLGSIIAELERLKAEADEVTQQVKESGESTQETAISATVGAKLFEKTLDLSVSDTEKNQLKSSFERAYQYSDVKLQKLNLAIPQFKQRIREVFENSSKIKSVFVELDDFYHLPRTTQPHIADFVHRLCKDVPLFFKIATLRHTSHLYAERSGQPTGIQERHDFQPINVDFTLQDLHRTEKQLRKIFHEFAVKAGIEDKEFNEGLFKGDGFRRLILAGGGVPRDCLSLFLDALENVSNQSDRRIGKDDVRQLSLENLQHRIQEMKRDSERSEQETLLRGTFVIRQFCLEKKSNVFLVSEQLLQERENLRSLLNRLFDYRIIHNLGTAYTHKTHQGSFQAFMIDLGSYAHMRKLDKKFNEIDISTQGAKEEIRGAPVIDLPVLEGLWKSAPPDIEKSLAQAIEPDPQETEET
jgi:energy-coupling factor transporter ATP-binding protein EcfA2